jgi:chemotaxis protein methyltransferase CheR
MSDRDYLQIRAFIYEKTGLYFQDNKKYLLEGRVAKRLQVLGLDNFETYLRLLRSGLKLEEIRHFYDAITINETFFFRNEPQFEALEQVLVPELFAKKKSGTRTKVRIWSAACSSGEEAYTLAMIYLEKLKPRFAGLEFEIVGSDINGTVLETARKGVYREYSVRNMSKQYLDKYFVREDGKFIVKDEVRRCVRFDFLNLFSSPDMKRMAGFDIVMCCNVLIYFDTKSKTQVVSHLYDSLARGGYLFIGYAESLHGISTAYKLINFPKTVVYKKE